MYRGMFRDSYNPCGALLTCKCFSKGKRRYASPSPFGLPLILGYKGTLVRLFFKLIRVLQPHTTPSPAFTMSESNIKEGDYTIKSVAYPGQVIDIGYLSQGPSAVFFRYRRIHVPPIFSRWQPRTRNNTAARMSFYLTVTQLGFNDLTYHHAVDCPCQWE